MLVTFFFSLVLTILSLLLIYICQFKLTGVNSHLFSFFSLLFLGSIFIFHIGFNGTDIYEYISEFEKYSFDRLGFYGSNHEIFQGLFKSSLDLFLPLQSGLFILTAFRIYLFILIPLLLLILAPNSVFRTASISLFSYILFLNPFSFLGASNILSNFSSFIFFVYALLLLSFNGFIALFPFKDRSHSKIYTFIAFLMLLSSTLTHTSGFYYTFTLLISFSISKLLLYSNLISSSLTSLKLIPISIITSIVSFLVAYVLRISATSQNPDSTVLITGISTLLTLIFALNQTKRAFFFDSILNLDSESAYSYRMFVLNILIFLTFTSLVSFFFSLFGGGDAAERLNYSSISLNLSCVFYINAILRSHSWLSLPSRYPHEFIGSRRSLFNVSHAFVLSYVFAFSMQIFFFFSSAYNYNLLN
jgi:hypothetical protein